MSKVTIRILVNEVNKTFATTSKYQDIHQSLFAESIFEWIFGARREPSLAQYAALEKQKEVVREQYEYLKTLELRKSDVAVYQSWYDATKSYFDALIELTVINEDMKKLFEYTHFEAIENINAFKEFDIQMREKLTEMNEKLRIYNQLSNEVF